LGIQFFSHESLLIFGAGYVGRHLAGVAATYDLPVFMTTRSSEKFKEIKNLNVTPLLWGDPLPKGLTHIVSTIPPENGEDPVLKTYGEALSTPHMQKTLSWLAYLSTTGVYGDTAGDTVTEKSPLNAATPRAQNRIKAEQDWHTLNADTHIFRLSGIYGPNRDILEQILSGKVASIPADTAPTNRIHIDDIIGALLTSMAHSTPGETFNVSDCLPAPRGDVLRYAATVLGKEALLEHLPQSPPPADGIMGEGHRRVSNEKLRKFLGYSLKYPSYKEGLAANAALLAIRHS
jgi:hypothetical protein